MWTIGSITPPERADEKQLLGNIQLLDETGAILAEITGLILKRTSQELLLRFLQPEVPPALYSLTWKKSPLIAPPAPILPPDPESWLLFIPSKANQREHRFGTQLTHQLQQQGHNCIVVSPGKTYQQTDEQHYQLNPTNPEDFHQLIQSVTSRSIPLKGVVHLWGMAQSDNTCASTLHLVQALSKSRTNSSLWLITRDTQTTETETTASDFDSIHASTLWGLGRVIALEHPELNCRRIDLESTENQPIQQIIQELITPDTEDQIAYRQGDRHIVRLTPYASIPHSPTLPFPLSQSFQLKLTDYGLIDNLQLQPTQRQSPAPHDVEIQVAAAGLNFRDVLNVLGLLKDYYAENLGITHANQLTFGFECAGTIVAKGSKVSHLNIGDDVIATMLTNGVSRFVTTRSEFVIPKPTHISFAEAATLPLAFLTAYYGLHHLAKLQPGDKVLIHAAAGGVGQAAVQIAQATGAEIFATASPAKWDFLKAQGITHIINSRNLDFAAEVMEITEGKGVDVVLNSLNGEYIDKSFESLSPNGRFVELGKIGIWQAEKVQKSYPNAQYFPFDLGEVTKANPAIIQSLWIELGEHFNQNHFHPLPIKTFPIQNSTQAFRHMQQAKHIGKVVLTLPPDIGNKSVAINSNSSYLITGGLGALGLQVAQWIVSKGGKHVILMGRSEPSERAERAIAQLQSTGANVSIHLGDISNKPAVEDIIQQLTAENTPPLKGIIHAAGVIDDALLSQLSWSQFEKVMAPKVAGTWHLHQLTQSHPLDFFICFSSIASLIGSPGQGNYAAANAFMDALMSRRRSIGLPGLSINWGPWGDTGESAGMAARLDASTQDRMRARGVNPLTPEQAFKLLDEILIDSLNQPIAQVGAFSVDWPKFTAQLPPGVSLPVLEDFQSTVVDGLQNDRLQGLEKLKQVPISERRQSLMLHIQSEIADVLGYDSPEEIALDQPLGDLGVDSLMAVELANQLEYNLGPTIPASFLFEHPTLEGLVSYLIEQMTEVEFASKEKQ